GPDTKQEVLDTIKTVCKKLNVATVIVSHLPEIHAYLAERLIWIEGGKVVMDGEPHAVLKEFLKGMKPQVPLAEPLYDDVLIQLKDIKKRFWLIRAGKVLEIDGVNIDFKHGQITSIIGPSGAGKTTLLKAIGGISFPKEGEVLYAHNDDWLDILKYTPERMGLRQRISIMYQDFSLGAHSTIKNQMAYKLGVKSQEVLEAAIEKSRELGISNEVLDILYQLTDTPLKDSEDILAKLGFTHEIFDVLFPSYPIAEAVKYAEPVFEAVDLSMDVLEKYEYQLSGGEKVRTSLAMALATRPDFLLLDEPFGDLDPKTLRDVANSLKNINREFGTTIIIVSHHMDFVREVSHRAILVDAGAVIADGDANTVCDELIKRSNAPYLEHDLRELEGAK
ncbi:MAG: ABC transporter ATP-binding protein, partial [Methanosarcinales archaeon]|nr:ABC transporter ATP-binding protein [Methanosarcinales archaeon]